MGKTQISNGYNSKTVGCRRSCYTFPQPGWQALSTGKVKVIVKVKVDVWRSCKLTMCATWWWQLVDVCCLLITQAPIIPLILHDGDTRNFDIYPEANLQSLQPSPDADVELFRDFWPSSVAFRDDPSTFQCQLFWTESTSLLAGLPPFAGSQPFREIGQILARSARIWRISQNGWLPAKDSKMVPCEVVGYDVLLKIPKI